MADNDLKRISLNVSGVPEDSVQRNPEGYFVILRQGQINVAQLSF